MPLKVAQTQRGRTLWKWLFLLLVPLLLLGGYHFTQYLFSPFSGRLFDRELWVAQSGSDSPDNPRASMVHDLTGRHLRCGMTVAEVVKLLGEPDRAGTPDLLSYNLGMWSGYRIDYDSLDIRFRSGTVTSVRCLQH